MTMLPAQAPKGIRTRRTYTLLDRAVAAALQCRDPLDGVAAGIAVRVGAGEVGISFRFDHRLNRFAASIPGFAFDKPSKMWIGPLEEYRAVKTAVKAIRELSERMQAARLDIECQARSACPGCSCADAYAKGSEIFSGAIVSLNEFFVAQLKASGVVKIHHRSMFVDGAPALRVGDRVRARYGDNGRNASILPPESPTL